MSSPGPGDEYEVSASASVLSEIRRLRRQAAREHRGPQFLAALREIDRRLRRDPLEFGEALKNYRGLKMQLRVATVIPVTVFYAVHPDARAVFIQGLQLLELP